MSDHHNIFDDLQLLEDLILDYFAFETAVKGPEDIDAITPVDYADTNDDYFDAMREENS